MADYPLLNVNDVHLMAQGFAGTEGLASKQAVPETTPRDFLPIRGRRADSPAFDSRSKFDGVCLTLRKECGNGRRNLRVVAKDAN